MTKPEPRLDILITGASAGIGRDAALYLARSGHRVLAAGRRVEALAALAGEVPGRIVPLALDLDDKESIARAAVQIDALTEGRGVDALVNNAGYGTAGALAELSDEALRAQFETNVFGLMSLTRALLPAMMRRRSGRIVNISSVAGRVPSPILGAYHASKYALEALSDALRMELAAFGIRVVVVEPGATRSEFLARTMSEVARNAPADSPYARAYGRASEIEARFQAASVGPEGVVRVIAHAVVGRRPRARYVVPARFYGVIAFVKLMPTRLVDAIMRALFGLTRRRLGLGSDPRKVAA